MGGRLTRTNCDEAGDYVVPIVLSPRDVVSISDNMDEIALSSYLRGAIDKFAEFSSHYFISSSNHTKTCIQVKQLIFTFIIRLVN